MGSFWSSPQPLEQRLRNALYNKDRDLVATLLADASLITSQLPIEIYVEVAQRHWNWNVVQKLCVGATVQNLVALLTSAVLVGESYPYHSLFDFLQAAVTSEGTTMCATFDKYSLRHLFIITCHKQNDEMVDAFLDNGCFVPTDSAPLRFVVRRELSKRCAALVSSRAVRRILSTHEGLHDVVDALRKEAHATELTAPHKELVDALDDYRRSSLNTV